MRAYIYFAIALLLCAACADSGPAGTSTGNPAGHDRPDGGDDGVDLGNDGEGGLAGSGYCRAGDRTALSPSADSELDFSAADVLAFAEGTHEETLRWFPQDHLTYGPESGEQTVTITVTATGEVEYVEPATEATGAGGTGPGLLIDIDYGDGSGCTGWLEIGVEVHVASSGGALDETFETVLRTHHPLAASLYVSLEPDMLGGDFEVTATEGELSGFALHQLGLRVQLSAFGISGSLDGVLSRESAGSDNAVARGGNSFAEIGQSGCGDGSFAVGDDAEVAGVSVQDVLALVASDLQADITWEDATTTTGELSFAAETSFGCVLLDHETAGDLTLIVGGTLSMTSADGRLDGEYFGRLEAHLGAQGIERVEFKLADGIVSHTMPGANAIYGFPNEDLSSYDAAGLSVGVSWTEDDGATGKLALIGYVFAECGSGDSNGGEAGQAAESGGGDDEPANDEPRDLPAMGGSVPSSGAGGSAGGGSAGCRGADPFDVATATLL